MQDRPDEEFPEQANGDSGADDAPRAGERLATSLVVADEVLPEQIPILPLNLRPIFPGTTMPLEISDPGQAALIDYLAQSKHNVLGVVLARHADEEDSRRSELYEIGTVLRVLKLARAPSPQDQAASDSGDGQGDYDNGAAREDGRPVGVAHILFQSIRRFRRIAALRTEPVLFWKVEYLHDPEGKPDQEVQAYVMAVISSVKELLKLNPLFMEQLKMLVANLSHEQPGLILDLIASMTTASGESLQEILETLPLIARAEKLLKLLQEEVSIFQLQEKIKKNIEERISKQQKDYFLREQLKEIKKELGLEKDDKTEVIEKFKERIADLTLGPEAQAVIDEELYKLTVLEPASPEYTVARNYVDWLTVLPWGRYSEDNYDIPRAREVLDRDHYGLDDVKERILEFISVGRKTGSLAGSILLLVGPPGVGKTSIGHSVAQALGRKFYRFSLGGMRDEAEVKGHRRTYIGAMPGKFIQSLKTTGTANPVIMLDEVDKIGASYQGDPASALLEVLDPEQNAAFLDHYLDVRFDLSNVLFIATANQIDTIPAALIDRMELIRLPGYILQEKMEIARRYLIPRAMKDHGLIESDIAITAAGLERLIDGYAREAGVRNLENQIKKIFRKVTLAHAQGHTEPRTVESAGDLLELLGPPRHAEEIRFDASIPGVVTGLAWTNMGGATLYIEASGIKTNRPGLTRTGQLGAVMQESARIAYSYLRANSPAYFERHLVHLHVPAGATPKDGPSAGITMALALYSLVNSRPVPAGVAMTGEISLVGKVLPVGGIREKIIAARRIGIERVILPIDNRRDFDELPEYLRAGLRVDFVSYFPDVIKATFGAADESFAAPGADGYGGSPV